MLKEINDKNKLLELKNILDEFLDGNDCKGLNCEKCQHKRLCNNIYRLNTTISMRYLK